MHKLLALNQRQKMVTLSSFQLKSEILSCQIIIKLYLFFISGFTEEVRRSSYDHKAVERGFRLSKGFIT